MHVGTNDLVLDKIDKKIEKMIFNMVSVLDIKPMMLVYHLIILKTANKQLTQKSPEISISKRCVKERIFS